MDCYYVYGGRQRTAASCDDLWQIQLNAHTSKITFTRQKVEGCTDRLTLRDAFTGAAAGAITSLGGHLYTFGGVVDGPSPFSSHLWRFEPIRTQSDTWRVSLVGKAAADPQTQPEWPGGRWGHTLLSIDDQFLLLYGGSCPERCYGGVWLYVPPLSPPSSSSSAGTGGDAPSGRSGWVALTTEVGEDPQGGEFPAPRGGHSATVIGDYVYLLFGNNTTTSFSDLWCLSLPEARRRLRAWVEGGADVAGGAGAGGATEAMEAMEVVGEPLWTRLSSDCAADGGPLPSIGVRLPLSFCLCPSHLALAA